MIDRYRDGTVPEAEAEADARRATSRARRAGFSDLLDEPS